MLTLALDTSTAVGGVALLEDDALVSELIMNVKTAHSERLMSSVDAVMRAGMLSPSDLDAIACGIGPGSFTGVRIGVSAAKAMAYSLNIPLIGVSSLEALAYGRWDAVDMVWSLIDARHGRFYSAAYRPSLSSGLPVEVRPPAIRTLDSIEDEAVRFLSDEKAVSSGGYSGRVLFLGDGACVGRQSIMERFGDAACVPLDALAIQRPANCGLCGRAILRARGSQDPASLVPMYLRDSEAEVKLANGELDIRKLAGDTAGNGSVPSV